MFLKSSEPQAGTVWYLYMVVCQHRLHTHEHIVRHPARFMTLSDNTHRAAADIMHISHLQAVECECQHTVSGTHSSQKLEV